MSVLGALVSLSFFACTSSMPDKPSSVEQSESPPSASQVAEDLGYSTVVAEGEDYIVFADEDGYEQEMLKGWPDPPPKEPPAAQIVGIDSTGQESFANGIIHYTTWPYISDPPAIWDEKDPEISDTPEAIGTHHRTLRLLTSVKPTFLTVNGWNELPTPGKVYMREEVAAVEIYEYITSNRNPIERIMPDGHIEYYKIPKEVLMRPYIIVNAQWSVPPSVVDGKIVPEEYGNTPNAHWLFYIADKPDK